MSRGDDKRLRATVVLLGALLVEVAWLKFRVVPNFEQLYAEFGKVPAATEWVFGWQPYLIALMLAPAALIFAIRGADGDRRSATLGTVVAAVIVAGLGVGVIWALYQPISTVAGQVR